MQEIKINMPSKDDIKALVNKVKAVDLDKVANKTGKQIGKVAKVIAGITVSFVEGYRQEKK